MVFLRGLLPHLSTNALHTYISYSENRMNICTDNNALKTQLRDLLQRETTLMDAENAQQLFYFSTGKLISSLS